jgi:hypothetical protein
MNRQLVKGDLDSRKPVFTAPSMFLGVSGVAIPAAYIWSGLSKGGENRYLPVLFDQTDSEVNIEYIQEFSHYSTESSDDCSIRPIVYQDNSSQVEGLCIEITHHAKGVAESEVDTSLEAESPIQNAARYWHNEISERTLSYDRYQTDYGWLYRLQFTVFGTEFVAQLPIFLGEPDNSIIRDGLQEARIPCVSIAPDDVCPSEDLDEVETWIQPTIFSLG